MAQAANLATPQAVREKWAGLMARGMLRGALELARAGKDERLTRAAALSLYDSLMREAFEKGRMNIYSDARKVAVENGLGQGRIRAAETGMNESHPAHSAD